jgi:hypothetical protein
MVSVDVDRLCVDTSLDVQFSSAYCNAVKVNALENSMQVSR